MFKRRTKSGFGWRLDFPNSYLADVSTDNCPKGANYLFGLRHYVLTTESFVGLNSLSVIGDSDTVTPSHRHTVTPSHSDRDSSSPPQVIHHPTKDKVYIHCTFFLDLKLPALSHSST